jgi:hypothetical protein
MSLLRIKLWLANLVGFISAYPLVFVVGGVILLCVILFFSFCGKSEPQFDEQKIQDDINRARDEETNRLNNTLRESDNRVNAIDREIKQAEANTANAKRTDYGNKNNRELENSLREKLRKK